MLYNVVLRTQRVLNVQSNNLGSLNIEDLVYFTLLFASASMTSNLFQFPVITGVLFDTQKILPKMLKKPKKLNVDEPKLSDLYYFPFVLWPIVQLSFAIFRVKNQTSKTSEIGCTVQISSNKHPKHLNKELHSSC